MTLLAGDELDATRFFKTGTPKKRGSSFDLTIGKIFSEDGEVDGEHYTLQPNEMVQVTSAEVFDLPSNVTAHVSYKTALTHKGIWALTVGVVDPGWNCPVSTTLFNFSKVPFSVCKGDVFLRVSLFQHSELPEAMLRPGGSVLDYEKTVLKTATTIFGKQFLNADKVADEAGKVALEKMRSSGLAWVAGFAFVLAVMQLFVAWGSPATFDAKISAEQLREEVTALTAQVEALATRLHAAEAASTTQDTSDSRAEDEAVPTEPSD